MKRNLFIAFEGCDGAGSSTQVGLLKDYLNIENKKTFETKEPTNNLIGGLIRGVLTKNWVINPQGFQLLFAADRAHHLDFEILPALEKGNIITDRYFLSTIAFGSLGGDVEWLKALNKNFRVPDATFILDVPPKTCIARIKSSRAELELFEEEEKLCRIQKMYHKLAGQYPGVYLIDGNRDKNIILKDIIKMLMPYFEKEIIAISGPPGSGKGTIAKIIAEKIGFRHYCAGDLRRKMAITRGISLAELNALGEHKAFTDKEVDEFQKEIAEKENHFIVDSRLSYFFIPFALKIFLDINPDLAAKRVFEAGRIEENFKSAEEAKQSIEERRESDRKRYQKWYGLENIYSKANFHYIIDTTNLRVEEVVERILEILKKHELNFKKIV